jgi:hypothetical protein
MDPQARAHYFGVHTVGFERCFFPFGPQCPAKAISAHSIQNSGVLESVAEAGFVVMVDLKLSAEEEPAGVWRRVGRNEATTFTGLCNRHDTLLFKSIDTKPLQLHNSEQLFLLAYRSVLRDLHSQCVAVRILEKGFSFLAEQGRVDPTKPSAEGTEVAAGWLSTWRFVQYSSLFADALLAQDWVAIEHRIVHLDPPAGRFACSVVVDPPHRNRTRGLTQVPKWAALNVFPAGDHSVEVFSYPVQQRRTWKPAFRKYATATGADQKMLISKLVLRHPENLVLSPSYFDSWSEHKKQITLDYYHANLGAAKLDIDDADLTLF